MASPIYDLTDQPLLADPKNKYNNLESEPQRVAQQTVAEILLGVEEPALADDDAARMTYAIALQILFQLEQGLTPEIVRSQNLQHPGNATTYRDRYLHPGAARIVQQVLGIEQVAFQPPLFGV